MLVALLVLQIVYNVQFCQIIALNVKMDISYLGIQ
jgi:hypothetical protein